MRRKRIILVVVIFCSVTLPILLYLFLTSTIKVFRDKEGVMVFDDSHPYQYLTYNSECKASSHGIVALPYELQDEEFLSSRKGNEYSLVSNIGSNEYVCTGKCICDEKDGHRRAHSQTMTRSLTYLVAAFSTALAINKANEYFSHECVQEYEGSCPQNAILSETEICVEEENPSFEDEDAAIDELTKREWFCSGYCQKNPNLKSPEAIEAAEDLGCDKMRTSTQLHRSSRVKHGVSDEDRALGFKKLRKELKKLSIKEFENYYLHHFCSMNSLRDIEFLEDKEKNVYGTESASLCVGKGEDLGLETNPTVVCVEVFGVDGDMCMGEKAAPKEEKFLH